MTGIVSQCRIMSLGKIIFKKLIFTYISIDQIFVSTIIKGCNALREYPNLIFFLICKCERVSRSSLNLKSPIIFLNH